MNDVPTTGVTRVCVTCQQVYNYKDQHVCPKGGKAEVPPDPLVGATIGGRYLIESFLSSGGMGVVYRAKHTVLDKPLAIKLLREAQDPMMQQRFLLEAKSACHIGHENIVDITDFGVLHDGRPYLVMEFLQGQSLEAVIAKGALPPLRTCRIAEQIARGLHAVHSKGIVHRDLKPGNIFILERGRKDFVKILDFGIAKVMAGTRESLSGGSANLPNLRATATGTVLGTPEYLSPEQGAGEAFDARVDQYALGCIMYEMLTGQVPFRGNGPMSTLMKHLTEKPIPPRKRRPELNISETLEKIVLKAMAQQKESRYANMDELANVLQELIDSGTLPADPVVPRPSASLQTVAASLSASSAPPVELSPLTSGDMFAPTLQAAIPTKDEIAKERAKTQPESTTATIDRGNKAPSENQEKAPLATEQVRPIVLAKPNRLPLLLLGVAAVMVLLLIGVLVVRLGPGSKPSQPVPAVDLGERKVETPVPVESPPTDEHKVELENKTAGKVTVLCGPKKSCILDAGKTCELALSADARCEASATGFVSRSLDVGSAVKHAGKGQTAHLAVHLDAEKPVGKVKKSKGSKAGKGKKR
ncbi:MAG TPA: serine/threonine-protein kinase [Pseudomonadota bacterium]|nr:serine/threonine-protein kinase [Pseudomonadota bacterium]